MCKYTLLIFLVVGFVVWALWAANERPGLRPRLPSVAGAGLVLVSFVTLPWIKFSPAGYLIRLGPELIGDQIPEALAFLLGLIGWGTVAKVVERIESIGFIPGWLLFFLMPTTNVWVRVVILLVGLAGVLALLWFPLSLFIENRTVRRAVGLVQMLLGLVVMVLLLLEMPTIDAWGSGGSTVVGLVALVVGVRMSFGVWVAWVGLILIALGGLAEAALMGSESRIIVEDDLLTGASF